MHGHQIHGWSFLHLCPAITHVHLCWPVSVTSPKLPAQGCEHVCDSTYERKQACAQEKGSLGVCLCVFFQMLGFFQNGLEHYCHLWGLKCQNRARGEAGEIKLQTVKVIDDVSDRLTGGLK